MSCQAPIASHKASGVLAATRLKFVSRAALLKLLLQRRRAHYSFFALVCSGRACDKLIFIRTTSSLKK
jgi:hypothetical protein